LLELGLLAAAALVLIAAALWILFQRRSNPAQRERERRQMLQQRGRMTDGVLTDVDGELMHYSYSIGGVAYTASQEITPLRDLLPEDLPALIGPVTVKYSVRNPANSIVLSEDWSGLRKKESIPL
jgi:hypothetical protein